MECKVIINHLSNFFVFDDQAARYFDIETLIGNFVTSAKL